MTFTHLVKNSAYRVHSTSHHSGRLVIATALLFSIASAQQITINRIEQMPNAPSPYRMRDWKQVAKGYDSLVFDFNRAGTYLPLGRIVTNNVNYPNHNSFGLHSYVGTNSPNGREAINCLPAVVGATLADIDKSNQNGLNYDNQAALLAVPADLSALFFGGRRDIGWGKNLRGKNDPNRNGSKISPEAVGPTLLTSVLLNFTHNIQHDRTKNKRR